MSLPVHRLFSLAEYAYQQGKSDKERDQWESAIDNLAREFDTWLLDPQGTARAAGAAPPPSWWDDDEAGAEAMALAARMSAGSRG